MINSVCNQFVVEKEDKNSLDGWFLGGFIAAISGFYSNHRNYPNKI